MKYWTLPAIPLLLSQSFLVSAQPSVAIPDATLLKSFAHSELAPSILSITLSPAHLKQLGISTPGKTDSPWIPIRTPIENETTISIQHSESRVTTRFAPVISYGSESDYSAEDGSHYTYVLKGLTHAVNETFDINYDEKTRLRSLLLPEDIELELTDMDSSEESQIAQNTGRGVAEALKEQSLSEFTNAVSCLNNYPAFILTSVQCPAGRLYRKSTNTYAYTPDAEPDRDLSYTGAAYSYEDGQKSYSLGPEFLLLFVDNVGGKVTPVGDPYSSDQAMDGGKGEKKKIQALLVSNPLTPVKVDQTPLLRPIHLLKKKAEMEMVLAEKNLP